MKQDGKLAAKSLSATEYLLALHEPKDQVAVLLVNRHRGQTLQRIATAETIAASEFQRWLADQNRLGADVFVGMNPLKDGATNRTKNSILEIRHVYLDLDEDAKAALANVHDCLDVPTPNFVLHTSPAKYQVVWKIEGVELEQAESLLHSLANYFGGDTAATDAARVLRMPGFVNRKYADEVEFVVGAHRQSDVVHSMRDFTIPEDAPAIARQSDEGSAGRRMPRTHRSQSEADWAYAKRALARGDSPQEVIRRIADYRAEDKADPVYYARLTVRKAEADLSRPHEKQGDSRVL